MASRVYSAAQLRVAVQELLRRQQDPQWPELVVVYESDKPTSPLSVNTMEYARWTEPASLVCTSSDLYTYLGTGSLEDMIARLTYRIQPGGKVTIRHLEDATDVDNITEVLTDGYGQFNAAATFVRSVFTKLRLCRGHDMEWELRQGEGVEQRRVILRFTAVAVEPPVRIQVVSRQPSLGFERRTILQLSEVRPQVRIEVDGGPARDLRGALAVAFARLAWSAYKDHRLAEDLQQLIGA